MKSWNVAIDIDMVNRILHVNLPRLPPDIVEHCEGILSFEEAKEAISFMKNGKTPGSDGLPAEFFCWEIDTVAEAMPYYPVMQG